MAVLDKTSALGVYTVDPRSTQLKGNKNQIMGKDDFLKILITELTHQDPLDPLKDRDMIAQMAQLSQLEQITQFTHSVETFFKDMDTLMENYKLLQASSLVGRWIKAEGIPYMVKTDSEIMPVSFQLEQQARVIAKIVDKEGKVLHQEDLGIVNKGIHLYTPSADLPEGTYIVVFEAKDPNGNSIKPTVFGWGRAVEVNRTDNSLKIVLDKGEETELEKIISFR